MLVNVGLKRFVSASGLGGARRTSTFSLDAMASLIPGHASGSTVPTYTRATTATVVDFEGRLVTVPSGAARFQGARFVRNIITATSSEDATTWDKDAGTTVTLQGDGSYKVVIPAAIFNGITPASGATISSGTAETIGTMWIKADAPTTVYYLAGNGGGVTQAILAVTTTWQRFSTVLKAGGGVANMTNTIETEGRAGNPSLGVTTLYIGGSGHGAQLEQVTGQSNQNPSEYVSVGVLSAPYHGAGIDGAKWFATENGNTVI